MIKTLSILLLLVVSGCAEIQPYVDLGCAITTEEGRAEIRDKQVIKTDICGDLHKQKGSE